MKIEVLGTGCPKCDKLKKRTEEAVAEAGIAAEVVKVSELSEILKYGVMTTPALVIDGVVKVTGKVPDVKDILKLIQ